MDLPSRLEQALTKLYTAFYQDRLDPENCKYCAVGNICDNQDFWKHFTDIHGSEQLNYLGQLNQEFGKTFKGYSPKELLKTEAVFLNGCGYTFSPRKRLLKPAEKIDRDMMFNGMYSVVAYLCAIDGLSNIMDVSRRFESEMLHCGNEGMQEYSNATIRE